MTTENKKESSKTDSRQPDKGATTNHTDKDIQQGENVDYWKNRHEKLEEEYRTLQKLNQTLEDRLLNIVESFEEQKKELLDRVDYEKSTLMADMNKLSNKLVDARMKLHDYEEKEMIRQAENSANHRHGTMRPTSPINTTNNHNEDYDPNLI